MNLPRSNRFRSIFLPAVLLAAPGLWAQTVFTVTTSAGDQSANSLGWAVTSLNAAGDGAISINNGSANVTLTQPLAALGSSNVTLQGDPLNLFAQNSAQAQFLVTGSLVQNDHLFFQNSGSSGPGLNLAVTATVWTGLGGFTNFYAGTAPATTFVGGSGFTGSNGGNANVTIGFFTTNFGLSSYGGNGENITDTNGNGDTAGNGGNSYLTGTSAIMQGTGGFQVKGGDGGSVTELGTGTAQVGGKGGSATISYSYITNGPYGSFYLSGGRGGDAMSAGDGGNVSLITGLLTNSQVLNVTAGAGGSGSVASGNGGTAFVSIGTYSSAGSGKFTETGGAGGSSQTSTANGGNATLVGGSITIFGSPGLFQVLGGNGGSELSPFVSTINGGNGGSASVSLADFDVISIANLKLSGGLGGNGGGNTSGGQGGTGGATNLVLGNLNISNSLLFAISGGYGGNGGSVNAGGTGGQGGVGGDLGVTITNLNLGLGSSLILSGGTGGNGGAVASGGTGGNGGDGGDIVVSVGGVTLSSGTTIYISGGVGGGGGLAGTSGSAGSNGQASATFGDLSGGGVLTMGPNSVLKIGSGVFDGIIIGSENLQKTSAATLTLGGANNYAGGTSILAGTLVIDTGGALGSGVVQVGNGTLLSYINSANASNTTIVNNAGATLAFFNSSTAGTASVTNASMMTFTGTSSAGGAQITNSSGGTIVFLGSSTGGTASVDLLSNSLLDLSTHSGALTLGSIAGPGTITRASNSLFEGSNNASTTFSGALIGSGSLTKVGTGTWTLGVDNNSLTGNVTILGGTLAAGSLNALGLGSVVNNGVLMAGGVPGTFQVWNDYTQTSTGTLQMGLGNPGATSADKMNVGGNMVLNGTLALFDYGGLTSPPLGTTFTLIAGSGPGSLSGIFQNVIENFTSARFLPIYLTGSGYVNLLTINPSFQASAITPNQVAIGADLDRVVFKPQLNGLMSFLGTLPDPTLRTAMTELSPEDLVSLYSLGFGGAAARFDAVEHRLNQLREDVDDTLWMPGFSRGGSTLFAANMAPSRERAMIRPKGEDWSGFLSVNGGVAQVDSDANAAGYKTTAFGLTAAGLDIRLSREAAAGLLLSYQHGDVTFGSGGTLADEAMGAGLYGMVYTDGFYLEGLAEGSIHSYKTHRTGYNGIAVGSPQGTQFDGTFEMGYAFDQKQVHMGPYGSLQYTVVQVNAFDETGSQAPLSYPSQSQDSLLGQAGLQASGNLKLGGGAFLTPGIKVAYEHEFDYQGGTFQAGLGTGDVFTVAGPTIGQEGFLASAGADLAIGKELHFFLDYQGQFGRADMSSHQVDLGSRIGF